MIAAQVIGGLGNQMFQYAAGRALALRHETDLVLDLSAFRQQGDFAAAREFELDRLSIEAARAGFGTKLTLALARRGSPALHRLSGWRVCRERSLAFDPDFAALPNDTYLSGYWQSWRYFEPFAPIIGNDLQPRTGLTDRNRALQERMSETSSIFIHVRRGDYLSSPQTAAFHGVLGMDYYEPAIRRAQDRIAGLHAFVFSDDLEWCRKAFEPLGLDLTFVDWNRGRQSWQDLYLMASCRHAVIANSSFSWWGAWLGDRSQDREDRCVVAPRRWFAASDVQFEDRCPPRWMSV